MKPEFQPSLLEPVPSSAVPHGLREQPVRPHVAQTSREAFDRIRPALNGLELKVCLLVYSYLEQHDFRDVTGGELAQWSGMPVTSVRPRLTGCVEKGYLHYGASRVSRAPEQKCCPVYPALPREAFERAARASRQTEG